MSDRHHTALVAGERIRYNVRRSRKAKHILLHIDVAGHIEVVLPARAAWQEAERIVRDKEAWIHRHRSRHRKLHRQLMFVDGSELPFLGETLQLRVRRDEKRHRGSVIRRGSTLWVTVPSFGSVQQVVGGWYRRQAHVFFRQRAEAFAEKLSVSFAAVSVGNHKTQWGSATPQGRLAFNWRLLLGPLWVVDYVVAHEVAHLLHLNHSSQYWATVACLYPQYKQARRWLRRYAGQLMW